MKKILSLALLISASSAYGIDSSKAKDLALGTVVSAFISNFFADAILANSSVPNNRKLLYKAAVFLPIFTVSLAAKWYLYDAEKSTK